LNEARFPFSLKGHLVMPTATENATVSLVNISTQKWPPRQRTYFGSLEVRSPEPGEAFAVTPIRGCTGVMDLGDKRIMEYRITAREIADDIAREINGDSGEGSFHGVFVAAGETPTEEELAEARALLDEFHRRLVAAADLEWERSHNPMFITDLERRAARELRLEKPWLYDRSRWPIARFAAKRSSRAWRCAAPAARSSTGKKPRSSASSPGKIKLPRSRRDTERRRDKYFCRRFYFHYL
jgi:hypothetical protein